MDEFTQIMSSEFDREADAYLDKLLKGLKLTNLHRRRLGQEPMSIMELAQKTLSEMRPEKFTNISVALAAALFRLQEK